MNEIHWIPTIITMEKYSAPW